MTSNVFSVREMQKQDISRIADYWLNAEPSFLHGMGVDISKMFGREEFVSKLSSFLDEPLETRTSYCLIWEVDGLPVGHCNTNPTTYGEEAYMHLHIWNTPQRKQGMGAGLVKMSLPFFFERLKLKRLYCQPYALNPAPNKTVQKVGFELEKEYVTTPGFFNFEQPVKKWLMTYERFQQLKNEHP
jgi:RimJ/RimL family protein N-acetyltransferase